MPIKEEEEEDCSYLSVTTYYVEISVVFSYHMKTSFAV
jgi:hypothetical protein